MNEIPTTWYRYPTQDEMKAWADTEFEFAKYELSYRLNQYIADGYAVNMTKDEFEELANELDEQIDWQGTAYIGDWLHDELEERGYVKEEE